MRLDVKPAFHGNAMGSIKEREQQSACCYHFQKAVTFMTKSVVGKKEANYRLPFILTVCERVYIGVMYPIL